MSLQTARQLLRELEAPTQPSPDSTKIIQVLKSLLGSHDHIFQQACKFNQVSLGSSLVVDWSRERAEALSSNEATACEELQGLCVVFGTKHKTP